jgi:hypothetical protein
VSCQPVEARAVDVSSPELASLRFVRKLTKKAPGAAAEVQHAAIGGELGVLRITLLLVAMALLPSLPAVLGHRAGRCRAGFAATQQPARSRWSRRAHICGTSRSFRRSRRRLARTASVLVGLRPASEADAARGALTMTSFRISVVRRQVVSR